MEAIVLGATLASSFAAAFWLQKTALEALLRALEQRRRE